MTERTYESLTQDEIDHPTPRDQSLAVVAAAVSDVLEARQQLRDTWSRHLREHGPVADRLALEAVETALGLRRA